MDEARRRLSLSRTSKANNLRLTALKLFKVQTSLGFSLIFQLDPSSLCVKLSLYTKLCRSRELERG
jgi:hypothetical protein